MFYSLKVKEATEAKNSLLDTAERINTMAHHRQKVKMRYSVLGVTNEKTNFFLVIPLDNR